MSGPAEVRAAAHGRPRGSSDRRNTLLRFADAESVSACLKPGFAESSLRFTIRGRDTVLLLDGALIHHCFVANAANYVHSPVRQRIARPVFGDAMPMTDGRKWKRLRKSVSAAFTAERLAGYARTAHAVCASEFAALEPAAEPVRLGDLFAAIAFETMSATLFSGAFSDERTEFLADIAEIMGAFGTSDLLDPAMAAFWLPETAALRDLAAIERCHVRIARAIDERLAAHRCGTAERTNDLLDMLVASAGRGLDDGELRSHLKNNVMSFIITGHETLAVALSWAFHLLSQSPAALERARGEADALQVRAEPPERWHEAAPFLRACIEESLRLHPPAPLIPRMAVGADSFGDCGIAAGSQIMIVPGLLHRLHRYWHEPDRFDPGRFLGSRRANQARFSYLPFGIGPKTCIGAGLALREAVIAAASFLHRFDLEYASPRPPRPLVRLAAYPDNGVPMRIAPRA